MPPGSWSRKVRPPRARAQEDDGSNSYSVTALYSAVPASTIAAAQM
jgi:hypothetical protein